MQVVGLLLFLTLLFVPHLAPAQPLNLDKTAEQHYELAVTAFRAEQWDAARAEFAVSFELSKRPDLLHNLSLTAERQGKLADALDYEQAFLKQAALTQAERDETASRIETLQARLGGAKPGSAAGSEVSKTVDEQPTPSPSRPLRAAGAVGIALGGSMLLAGLGTGISALRLKQDLESRPITAAELDQGRSLGQTLQTATIVLGVLGGALTIGSVVLLSRSARPLRPVQH